MKCPQCQRENQFPVPGLCPDCYKQWKEDMRARFGPGPWPAQPACARKDGQFPGYEIEEAPRQTVTSDNLAATIERSVAAVLARLQEPSSEESELLTQVDALLREVTRMLTVTAAVESGYSSSTTNTYPQAATP